MKEPERQKWPSDQPQGFSKTDAKAFVRRDSENGPFVLILQSYSQISIGKHNDWNLVERIKPLKTAK